MKGIAGLTDRKSLRMNVEIPKTEKTIRILNYQMANADIRDVERAERSIWVRQDSRGGFTIQGEISESTGDGVANLAQILLEYARSLDRPGRLANGYLGISAFAMRVGNALGVYVIKNSVVTGTLQRAAQAMASVLNSMDAQFTKVKKKKEIRFELNRCPLCDASEGTGIDREIDLSRHGLTVLCKSMVNAIDPGLNVQIPAGRHAIPTITLRE